MPASATLLMSWRPRPGNISSSLVYSWLTTSRPWAAGSAAPGIGK